MFEWIFGLVMAVISMVVMIYFRVPQRFMPRETKKGELNCEVPVSHKVSWWAYQDQMKVSSFRLFIGGLKMTAFKSKEVIGYEISGTLKGEVGWRPQIVQVHSSERFLHPDPYMPEVSLKEYSPEERKRRPKEYLQAEALITFTPIVRVEKDESYQGEEFEFTFRNECVLQSFHWGENRVRLQCREIVHDIYWNQRK
jgi:hypothetical protein